MSVLRRKIEARTGVPPTLQNADALWARLETCLRDWGTETFGFDPRPCLRSKKVLPSQDVFESIDPEGFFGLSGSADLLAIKADLGCLASAAAARMGHSAESLESGSPIFLKLLFEPNVKSMGMGLSGALEPGGFPMEPGICDVSALLENTEAGARCFVAEYSLSFEGRYGSLTVYFDFDCLYEKARQSLNQPSDDTALNSAPSTLLAHSVESSSVTLDAVLSAVELTIGRCYRLEVGDVLPLPGADPSALILRAETVEGPVEIGQGFLGAWKDQRALKLSGKLDTDFTQNGLDG